MKKFLATMVMLSVGFLTLGCEPPKKAETKPAAPAATDTKKEGDKKDEAKPAAPAAGEPKKDGEKKDK